MNSKADTANAGPIGEPEPIGEQGPDAIGTEQQPPPPAQAEATTLEMRQVAGLTAGSVMVLHDGSFQFRESEKDVGFSLVVDGAESVVVLPGSAAAMVDEIPVAEATPIGDAVLNVGSACFTVRSPRPAPSNQHRLDELESVRRPPAAVAVPTFDAASGGPTQTTSSRFGSLFSRDAEDQETDFDAETWRFLESIRDARSIVADRHRRLHPDPEELHSRLSRMDPGLWDRTVEHPMFARFPIAYSTIPWEPRFDEPERIPETLYEPIQEMSCLPWVPITANLLFGPLGIVGGRSAVLSCARNAVLSMACLISPTDIEFSIVTAQGLVEDWNWSSSLPNSLFPSGENKYCVAVADGMTHFEGAGFSHESVKKNEMGLIVLADTIDDLPDYCGTVLEVTSDGQCRVTNHLGEQVNGTPIGVTVNFAASISAMIRDAIGDGPLEDEDDMDLGLLSEEARLDHPEAQTTSPATVPMPPGPSGQDQDKAPPDQTIGADDLPNIDDIIDLGEPDDDPAAAEEPGLDTVTADVAGSEDHKDDSDLENDLVEFEDERDNQEALGGDDRGDREDEDLDSLADEVARALATGENDQN